jgi:hypothetical protein
VILSQRKHQIELVGPVVTDHHWQARVEGGFVTARFQLDWDRLGSAPRHLSTRPVQHELARGPQRPSPHHDSHRIRSS